MVKEHDAKVKHTENASHDEMEGLGLIFLLQLLSILRRKQLRSKEVRKLAQGELVDHAVGFAPFPTC